MLDEFRSTNITWDKATRRIHSPIIANESDSNGRKLVVQIVNSGQVEDLTGAALHLYWETRDKLHDGLDVFKAVDLKKGEFELSYTTGMLSNHGELNANLVLVDTAGRVVSERFKITVTEGINDDAIQSENSFSSLTQALIDISDLEQNYAPRLTGVETGLSVLENKVIVDSGRNTGGNWIKFADGTMICYMSKIVGVPPNISTGPNGSMFRSTPFDIPFPINFVGASPAVTHSVDSDSGFSWTALGNEATNLAKVNLVVFSPSNTTSGSKVSVIAIGRWK